MVTRVRDRFGGKAQIVCEPDEKDADEEEIPWSLDTFPLPDKKRFGKKKGVEYAVATERLWWKDLRTLAFRPGAEYPANIRDQLMTREEMQE